MLCWMKMLYASMWCVFGCVWWLYLTSLKVQTYKISALSCRHADWINEVPSIYINTYVASNLQASNRWGVRWHGRHFESAKASRSALFNNNCSWHVRKMSAHMVSPLRMIIENQKTLSRGFDAYSYMLQHNTEWAQQICNKFILGTFSVCTLNASMQSIKSHKRS